MPIETQEPELDLGFLLEEIPPPADGASRIRTAVRRRRVAVRATSVAASLLLAAGLASLTTLGDGSTDARTASPADVVRAAPEAVAAAGSAQVTFVMEDPDGETSTFEGVYDFRAGVGTLSDGESDARLFSDAIFVSTGDDAEGGPRWLVLDQEQVEEVSNSPGPGARALGSVSILHPANVLALLGAAAEVEAAPADPGEPGLRRYRMQVERNQLNPWAALAARVVAAEPEGAVDVWLDSQGRVVRLRTMVTSLDGDGFEMTVSLAEFGVGVAAAERPTQAVGRFIDYVVGPTQTVTGSCSMSLSSDGASSSDCTTGGDVGGSID